MKFKIFLTMLFIFSFTSGGTYFFVKSFDEVIYPCVYVDQINVSKMNFEEASTVLSEKHNKMLEGNIVVTIGEYKFEKPIKSFDVKSDLEGKIENILSFGKDNNDLKKLLNILNPKNLKLDLKYTYNQIEVENWVNHIEKETRILEENSKITRSNGKFIVSDEKIGKKLKKDILIDDIKNKLANLHFEESIFLEGKMEDVFPKIRFESLKSINKLVSTFSTNFGGELDSRGINIKLATDEINGKVVMPGEVFSFNDIVGMSTPDKGYQLSPVVVGNKIEQDYGGGICQVSTTLYNAVLRASLLPIERRNHTLLSSYARAGMDAAISYGSLDFKFKNTLEYPIYLEGYLNGEYVVFNIYSNDTLSNFHYDVISEVYNVNYPKEIYKEDSSLKEGEIVKIQGSSIGCSADVYMIQYDENNCEISRKLISTDLYNVVDAIYLKGVKKAR